MSNVVKFTGITRLPVPVSDVLQGANDAELSEVVICGYDAEGDMYFASSEPDGPSVLWLLRQTEKRLLDICEEYSE